MKETIEPKSYVLVSKTPYGAILPNSSYEIPILSLIFKKFNEVKFFSHFRLPGFRSIEHHDIVVAKYKEIKIAKRIIGLPGDTISIDNGFTIINGAKEKILDNFLYSYTATLNNKQAKVLKNKSKLKYLQGNQYNIVINGKELRKISKDDLKVQSDYKHKLINKGPIFPKSKINVWDENFYGPIVVPYKGMTINTTDCNFNIYKNFIEDLKSDDIVKIKDDQYIFRNNFYFVLGDNRMESIDSRFIGFLSKNDIIGKLLFYK